MLYSGNNIRGNSLDRRSAKNFFFCKRPITNILVLWNKDKFWRYVGIYVTRDRIKLYNLLMEFNHLTGVQSYCFLSLNCQHSSLKNFLACRQHQSQWMAGQTWPTSAVVKSSAFTAYFWILAMTWWEAVVSLCGSWLPARKCKMWEPSFPLPLSSIQSVVPEQQHITWEIAGQAASQPPLQEDWVRFAFKQDHWQIPIHIKPWEASLECRALGELI